MTLLRAPANAAKQIAQRHGLFTATEGQILDMSFFEVNPDVDIRWKTWSRIESVKRYVSNPTELPLRTDFK